MTLQQIERRIFIAALGGAVAWPMVARGQQADRVRRVGVLTGRTTDVEFSRGSMQCGSASSNSAGAMAAIS